MAQQCECNVVGNFPHLAELGFISITLRTNTPVLTTSDGLDLIGATTGELSVTGYGSLNGYPFSCPGRAGANYDWMQKYDCLNENMYYIPRGGAKSFVEGDIGVGVTNDISIEGVVKYESVQASASSGPGTVYLKTEQTDGKDFQYLGGPIQVYGRLVNVIQEDGNFLPFISYRVGGLVPTNELGAIGEVLPEGSELFLMNVAWEQTPPDIPTVSYSFAFNKAEREILIAPETTVHCSDGSEIAL